MQYSPQDSNRLWGGVDYSYAYANLSFGGGATHNHYVTSTTANTTSTGSTNPTNYPPYVITYMYKRTA